VTTDGESDDPENDPLLRSMRSVWLGMREEEPPARGLAELMAAARAQADVMKPTESWWRRSFALLVRPPVLAAATVLVIVGGAIALNRGGGTDHAASPVVESGLRADQAPAAKQQVPGADKDTGGKELKLEEGAAGSGSAAADDRWTPPRDQVPNGATAPLTPRPPTVQRPPIVNNEVKEPPPPPPPPPPNNPHGGGEGLVIAGDAPKVETTKSTKDVKTPADAPRPEPVKTEDAELDAGGRSPTIDRPAGRQPAPVVTTDQLVKQAQVAASRKDCPAVRATAERVKKTDPSAYKTRLTTQPAIARCLK
jgi:hypothetical protein